MGTFNNQRHRWNLLGFAFSILLVLVILGLILNGKGHKVQLEVVLHILAVVSIVAAFAIITRNVKRMCNCKLKKIQ